MVRCYLYAARVGPAGMRQNQKMDLWPLRDLPWTALSWSGCRYSAGAMDIP